VESRVGEGTSFRIYLPRIHPLPEPARPDPGVSNRVGGGATVLVVEDQEAVRRLTKLTLASLGYHVLEAESGARACELAATFSGEIHLLLTDIVMPGINGRELALEILQLRPNLKVLLMSGYAEDVILPPGLPESEIAFLPKPFTQDVLAAKVREVLGLDDDLRGLTGQLVEDHVGVRKPTHLQHAGVRSLDRLLGDLDLVLPLAAIRPQRRQFVNAA
jgi:CheY-like chemotaxis protein